MLVAATGVALAGVLAVRRRQPELLPLLPPAAALWFGIYLHDIQMLLALPAAILIASRVSRERFRMLAAIGLALLAAVWTQRTRIWLLLDAVATISAFYIALPGSIARRVCQSILGALTVATCLLLLQHAQPPPTALDLVSANFHSLPSDSAAIAWSAYLRGTPALTRPDFDLKIPTWIGLTILMLGALRMCVAVVPTPTLSGSREPLLVSDPYSVSS